MGDEKNTKSKKVPFTLGNKTSLLPAHTDIPDEIFILPVSERPFFPPQTLPILLNEGPWLESVRRINKQSSRYAGLLLAKTDNIDKVTLADFCTVGTLIRIHHPVRSSQKVQFIAEGIQRFEVLEWKSQEAPFLAKIRLIEHTTGINDELKAYGIAIVDTLKELLPLNPLYSEELKFFLNRFSSHDPSPLTDFAASLTTANRDELQDILAEPVLQLRMQKVMSLVKKEIELVRLQTKIRQQVEETLSEQQRTFFLREQLKTIQKELGIAKDDRTVDRDRFEDRLEDLDIPEPVVEKIDEELDKLSILEIGSPEYALTRNYLDILTTLPWNKFTKDKLNLKRARQILNRDHEGLEDLKDRIIEFLAVGALRGEISGSIILFLGPPGVGKTSIGRSIANAIGRKFYRFSVGGMRDEAEIKGHRRTYIGAMPGKIIQALLDTHSANPVIMLDEIDKIGSSYQGDPASALLEVLDPEQNYSFLDHYLDVRFDLSKVLFICTANQLDSIPRPLLDRMEIMRLSGYITSEKFNIARKCLWPRELAKSGLTKTQLQITDAALKRVIEDYAREAGVRSLEKLLGKIIRKSAVKIVNRKAEKISVGVKDIEEYLGSAYFTKERPYTGIGVVMGLAWTALGGATLPIEATLVHHSNRGLKVTGQLGSVMQESAEIAYSFVLAHLEHYGIDPKFFDNAFIHLHVPEGATPKDGPSAGITMATALISLARGEKIRRTIGMTGELTLSGQVLAVGGIREKIIAAKRIGLTEIILPDSVRSDFDELPSHIVAHMKFKFVKTYKQVFDYCFKHK